MRDYSNLIGAFYGAPWAILPAKLAEIEAVLLRRLAAGPLPLAAMPDPQRPSREDAGYQLFGSAAVVPVQGTITPRPSMFAEYSGGTSAEGIGRAVEAAAADPKADAIVLNIDSPGGHIAGIPEASAKILAARKLKPVHAVANHQAASAAYWLGSQATTFAVSPSAEVGSIGVIMATMDETKRHELLGVKYDLVSSTKSPYKTEGYPHVPMTEMGRAEIQRVVDQYAEQFIAAIAKGRGVRAGVIERDFGQGRMKMADEAVAAKMADRIASLETVVNEINGAKTARTKRRVAGDMAAAGLRTAS